MNKSDRQPELFKDFEGIDSSSRIRQKTIFKPAFLDFKVSCSCEHLVVALIAVMMLCIIFFAFGLEHGKRAAIKKSAMAAKIPRPATHIKTQSSGNDLNNERAVVTQKSNTSSTKNGLTANANQFQYTIQIATFKKEDIAKKETAKLQKEGFAAILIKAEEYYFLFLGKYKTKAEAELALNKIKKNYKDSFIRRL